MGLPRIEGALANLGHRVARTTVANILRRHGLDPAPERGRRTPWRTFLGAHWTSIAAIDFTTVEVWCKQGLVTFYVLFVLELSTRRVHCAGVTPGPDERWMMQIGRNLTDCFDGFLQDKHFVIMDRDSKYTDAFRAFLTHAGVQAVRLPARSPNLNAWVERFVRSIKEECLDRMIFFGESSLRHAVGEFIAHYHTERNHQGLGNRIIEPDGRVARASGPNHLAPHVCRVSNPERTPGKALSAGVHSSRGGSPVMRTVREILEEARRLPPEDRVRLLEYLEESLDDKTPVDGRAAGPYATSLLLSGTLQTDFSDVSSDKYKHVAEASRDNPPKQ